MISSSFSSLSSLLRFSLAVCLLSFSHLSYGFNTLQSVAGNHCHFMPAGITTQLKSTYTSREKDTFERRAKLKSDLFTLIKETPNNKASSRESTRSVLAKVEELVDASCPTADEEVLKSLAGNWELLWTAQDQRSQEWRNNPIASWINPLENQSYSNNPTSESLGRSNPFLPAGVQDRLEAMGIVQQAASTRSSQFVDLKKQRVRNVVSFQVSSLLKKRITLVVDIQFTANSQDARRIDVKFESCLISIPDIKPLKKIKIPLGFIGPRGWLSTQYIDDDFRITRSHKGSVFVLIRAKSQNL